MSRYRPGDNVRLEQENESLHNELNNLKQKKKSQKEKATSRAETRNAILANFCKQTGIPWDSEFCFSVRKIFRMPYTKNISLACYKSELDMLAQALGTLGIEKLTSILVNNASKNYLHLVYENQLKHGKGKSSNKDNIVDNKTHTYGESRTLKDFDGYRIYLKNDRDDEELRKFVYENFNIVV